jgi:hypothetical protein
MHGPGNPLSNPDTTASGLFGGDDTSPLGRQTLIKEELLERLTAMMQSCEGCEKVKVLDVYPLDPPDKAGCNWMMTLVLQANGVEAPVYSLGYGAIIAAARESWNLAL